MEKEKRKVRIWVERINNPVCSFHSGKVAFYRLLSEERQTIFLCKECQRDLEKGTLNLGKDIEIEWKRKVSLEDEFPDKMKSNWMVHIKQARIMGEFGKKNKLPYTPLSEEKRSEFGSEVFLAGKPEKTMEIQGKTFLFSFDRFYTFVFAEKQDTSGNYLLQIIYNRKNGENIFPEDMKFKPDFWDMGE